MQHHEERSFELPDQEMSSIRGTVIVDGSSADTGKVADVVNLTANAATSLQMLHFLNGKWADANGRRQDREIKATAQVGSYSVELRLFCGLPSDISEEDLRDVVIGNIMPTTLQTSGYFLSRTRDKHLVPSPMAVLGLASSQLFDSIEGEESATAGRRRTPQAR